MKALTFLFVILLFVACDMQIELKQSDSEFIIPEGRHSSVQRFEGFDGTTLRFEAKFNKCAKYQTVNPANQADINKLMGFSTCSSHHHQNSVRIGWRWYNDKMEIFGYAYIDGERREVYITDVPVGNFVLYEIKQQEDGYYFYANGTEASIKGEIACGGQANYMLWPYFGGDEPAPHEIQITIEGITQE